MRAADEVPGVATYEAYTSSVKRVCLGEGSTSDVATPWKEARQNPLVTYVHVDYPDILSPDSDAAFKNIVDRVKGDKESLNAEIDAAKEANVFASQIEKSSILYASRMNTLYACAILNTKLRANTRILEEFRPQGSNIISQVERSTEQMRRRLGELQCRDVSKESTE